MAYKITQQLVSGMANQGLAKSSDIDDTASGKKQSEINSNLMAGKIYKGGEWVSNISDPTAATTDKLGGIKVAGVRTGSVTAMSGGTVSSRFYGVELDAEGKAFVHVPWTDSQYKLFAATAGSLGGVKVTGTKGLVMTDDNQDVLAVNFDTTDYSDKGDMAAEDFSTDTVASPKTVNDIVEAKLQHVFYDILNTPL